MLDNCVEEGQQFYENGYRFGATPEVSGDASIALQSPQFTKTDLFCVSVAAGVTVWGVTRLLSALFGDGK